MEGDTTTEPTNATAFTFQMYVLGLVHQL